MGSMSKTKITAARAVAIAVGSVETHETRLLAELKALESGIADIRRDLKNGRSFEALNLVKDADAIARRTAKLQIVRDTLAVLDELDSE